MNIIVHYPQSAEDADALRKRVAEIHAQAVLAYVQKLPCSKEQKLNLYAAIKKAYRE